MAKKDMKIFAPQWLEFHPYNNSVNSDLYYLQLSNRVAEVIDREMEQIDDENYLFITNNEKKDLACILTSYFEDIISQTNIWNTLTRESKAKLGSFVPFFATDDYAEEEINIEDLQFLIWHYITQLNQGMIPVSPKEIVFSNIAKAVYDIFDQEYESAPENDKMKEFFTVTEEKQNIFDLQNIFFWLGTESYLFKFNSFDMEKELDEVIALARENGMEEHLPEMGNMVMSDFSFNNVTEFFRLTAAQWLGKMLPKKHPMAKPLLDMSKKISGYFIYQGEDGENAQLKHVATGEILDVTQKSMKGFPKDLKSLDVVLFAGLIKWQKEWWFVGDLRGYDLSDALVEDISSREDEINLFNPVKAKAKPKKEQVKIAANVLEEARNENPDDEELDICWNLLYENEISSKYIKDEVLAGTYPDFHFPGEDGEELMKNNIDFVISYFRR